MRNVTKDKERTLDGVEDVLSLLQILARCAPCQAPEHLCALINNDLFRILVHWWPLPGPGGHEVHSKESANTSIQRRGIGRSDSPTEPRMTEPRMGLLSEWTQPRMGLNPEWDFCPNGLNPEWDST